MLQSKCRLGIPFFALTLVGLLDYDAVYAFQCTNHVELLSPQIDPFLEKTAIKKAYKNMALQYHPDIVVDRNSTPQDKVKANDDFAKINRVYELLMCRYNTKEQIADGSAFVSHRRQSNTYKSSYWSSGISTPPNTVRRPPNKNRGGKSEVGGSIILYVINKQKAFNDKANKNLAKISEAFKILAGIDEEKKEGKVVDNKTSLDRCESSPHRSSHSSSHSSPSHASSSSASGSPDVSHGTYTAGSNSDSIDQRASGTHSSSHWSTGYSTAHRSPYMSRGAYAEQVKKKTAGGNSDSTHQHVPDTHSSPHRSTEFSLSQENSSSAYSSPDMSRGAYAAEGSSKSAHQHASGTHSSSHWSRGSSSPQENSSSAYSSPYMSRAAYAEHVKKRTAEGSSKSAHQHASGTHSSSNWSTGSSPPQENSSSAYSSSYMSRGAYAEHVRKSTAEGSSDSAHKSAFGTHSSSHWSTKYYPSHENSSKTCSSPDKSRGNQKIKANEKTAGENSTSVVVDQNSIVEENEKATEDFTNKGLPDEDFTDKDFPSKDFTTVGITNEDFTDEDFDKISDAFDILMGNYKRRTAGGSSASQQRLADSTFDFSHQPSGLSSPPRRRSCARGFSNKSRGTKRRNAKVKRVDGSSTSLLADQSCGAKEKYEVNEDLNKIKNPTKLSWAEILQNGKMPVVAAFHRSDGHPFRTVLPVGLPDTLDYMHTRQVPTVLPRRDVAFVKEKSADDNNIPHHTSSPHRSSMAHSLPDENSDARIVAFALLQEATTVPRRGTCSTFGSSYWSGFSSLHP